MDIADDDIVTIDGVGVTSALRTTFDCARWLTLTEAVVVADALARTRVINAAALAAYLATHRGARGVRRCEQVITIMDGRSESPMESRRRVLLIESGLPWPEPQYEIEDGDRQFVARADLAYPQAKLAVEYDGAWHWRQRRADDRRRDAMRDLAWEVIVVSSEDYFHHPDDVIAKVRRSLERRGTHRLS